MFTTGEVVKFHNGRILYRVTDVRNAPAGQQLTLVRLDGKDGGKSFTTGTFGIGRA